MTEAAIAWNGLSVRYPYQPQDAVGPVSLRLEAGERLLVLGPSGCGKSTLLATVTGLLPSVIPADVGGDVTTLGRAAGALTPALWAPHVAQLFQDADQTLCGMSVEDEIAFALENQALPEADILARVERAMAQTGLPAAWRSRRTATLSGGEKQLVAFAAALAQDAAIFVADEPTAHLSPQAASRLHALLGEDSRSVLLVDHRLDGLIDSVDRVAVIGPDGMLIADGPPRDLFRAHGDRLDALGIWRPLANDLDRELIGVGIVLPVPPLSMREAVDQFPDDRRDDLAGVARHFVDSRIATANSIGPVVARLENAACAPLFAKPVLHDVTLEIAAGETVAILGRNGAGKSTLGASLAGLLRLKSGKRTGAPGGIAFQRPENQFTAGSVLAEIESALDLDRKALAMDILGEWGLAALAKRHPFELSQGQKRRLALATLTADDRWPLLVLDEPTAGLDAAGAARIAGEIVRLGRAGRALAVITHDLDFALATCARGIVLADGRIIADRPLLDIARDDALLARAGLGAPGIAPLLDWLDGQGLC